MLSSRFLRFAIAMPPSRTPEITRGLLQGRPLQLPMGWGVCSKVDHRVGELLSNSVYKISPWRFRTVFLLTKSAYKIRLARSGSWEWGMGCQLLARTFPCRNCRGLSCSGPLATPKKSQRLPRQDKAMLHCDLRVRWKVASDLRFWAATLSPKPLLSVGFLAIWLRQRGNR